MSLNREALLRELELLPVWQLRQPVSAPASAVLAQDAAPVIAPEVEAKKAIHQFRLMTSDDAQWAFVLEQRHDSDAEALLQNMLKAVAIKVAQDSFDANRVDLNQLTPKVIVVMGESEAQQLLSQTQTLDAFRSKQHQHQSVPVVVTYSASHLLLNLADKAKAWEDLCLAKSVITPL